MSLAIDRFAVWYDESSIAGGYITEEVSGIDIAISGGIFDPTFPAVGGGSPTQVFKGAQSDFFFACEFVFNATPANESGVFVVNYPTGVSLGFIFGVSGSVIRISPHVNGTRAADYAALPTLTPGSTYRCLFRIPGSSPTYDGELYFTGSGSLAKSGSVDGGFPNAALTHCAIGKGLYLTDVGSVSSVRNITGIKFGFGHVISGAEALDYIANGVSAPPPLDAPGVPTTLAPSAVGSTTFTAGWGDPASGGAPANYEIGVRHRATSSASLGTYAAATGSPVGDVNSLAISDSALNGQLTQFRVRATNAAGPSAWVESAEFWMINDSTSGGGGLPVETGGGAGSRRVFVPLTVDGMPAASVSVDYAILSAGRISLAPTVLASGTATTNGDGYLDVSFASALPVASTVHLVVDTSGGDSSSATARMMNAPVVLL